MTSAPGPAARLAALLRRVPGGLDRIDLHDLLDAALDVAADASDARSHEGRLANAAALALARAAAGWTVPALRSSGEWNELAEQDPAQWREEVVACIEASYSVVPQAVLEALKFGLAALNNNIPAPPILAPQERPRGYGRAPTSRRHIEQALLFLAEIEKARGRPAEGVHEGIAAAVGRTADAIEGWLRQWRGRDGRERVTEVLAVAGRIGRGEPVQSPLPQEAILIAVLGGVNGGALKGLARSWAAAAS